MPAPISSSSSASPLILHSEPARKHNLFSAFFASYIKPFQQQLIQLYLKHVKPLKDRILRLETANFQLRRELEREKAALQSAKFEAGQTIATLKEHLARTQAASREQGAEILQLRSQIEALEGTCRRLGDALEQAEALLAQKDVEFNNSSSNVAALSARIQALLAQLQAERAGRTAARIIELRTSIEKDESGNIKSGIGMGVSILPLSLGLIVGGPLAWGFGIATGITMCFGSATFLTDTTAKREELNTLLANNRGEPI